MPPARKPKLVQTGTGWKFRARQTNGERPWIHLPAMPREKAEKLALETANLLKTHTVEAIPRRKSEEETVSDWFSRWCKLRRTKGLRTVDDDESRFENHIKPLIGERPMSLVTKVDIERLRDTLDARIRERQAVEIDLAERGGRGRTPGDHAARGAGPGEAAAGSRRGTQAAPRRGRDAEGAAEDREAGGGGEGEAQDEGESGVASHPWNSTPGTQDREGI
jgi:hypothetical protein